MNDRVENPGTSTDSGLFNFDFIDDISNHVDSTIDSTLGDLEAKVSEAFDPVKVNVASMLEQIPVLGVLMSDFIANLKADGLNTTAMAAPEVTTRFNEYISAAGVELTPVQREIFGWTQESIQFWNQNLPEGVPSMPPSVTGMMFGLMEKESGFNYTAANPNSSARGLGQFLTSSWRSYIEDFGPLLQQGAFTAEEINNPNARTENPRLMVYMINRFIIRSYSRLSAKGFLPQGWQTENIEFMLYICHHHGAADGIRHLRYLQTNDPQEQQAIRQSMVNPQFLDGWDYGETTAKSMRDWQARFQQGNNPAGTSQVA
jgi:hypothetical protein